MNRLQRSEWSNESPSIYNNSSSNTVQNNTSNENNSEKRKYSIGMNASCSSCLYGTIIGVLCAGIPLTILLTLWLTSSTALDRTKDTTILTSISFSAIATTAAAAAPVIISTTGVSTTLLTSATVITSITTKTSTTTATVSISTTTVTTSTTTGTITTTTVTTSSTSITTTTSTRTVTTATVLMCNSTCGNDSTVKSAPFLARWNFDNTLADSMSIYNGTGINGANMTTGYIDEALYLNSSLDQYVSTSFISLFNSSFTIDGWIYPTGFPNLKGIHSIVGLCPQQLPQQCLQIGLRSNTTSSSSTVYFGLWESADLRGTIPVRINQWTHIAIVYAKSKAKQVIYINGVLDNSRGPSNGSNAMNGTFYIGNNNDLTSNPSFGRNYFQGYIDQLTVTGSIRIACEILNVATMAARFSFDNTSDILADYGPNNVTANAWNYLSVNGLKGSNAILLNDSASSYMNASGFRFFSYNNIPFSISLWIEPITLQGSIINSSMGYSLLYFGSNGSLISQINNVSVLYNTLIDVAPNWSHIVLTWSSVNGLRLYVNNQLVGNTYLSTLIGSGMISNSLILGGQSFQGAIDEWRIYSRELSKDDICALFVG